MEKALGVICILLMVCLVVPSLSAPPTVRYPEDTHGKPCPLENDYRSTNGFCCNKCHKGESLKEHCTGNDKRTTCKPCGNNTYMAQINYADNCNRCTQCKANHFKVEHTPCDKRQNRVCRCMDGYYKYYVDIRQWECEKCTTCGPEERQTRECTTETNTECECKDSYRRIGYKCVPCKNCISPGCEDCSLPESTPTPKTNPVISDLTGSSILLPVAFILPMTVVTVLLVIMIIKKMRTMSSTPPENITSQGSDISTEKLIYTEDPVGGELFQAVPVCDPNQVCECEQPLSQLPDCVPHEIKIPQLIYSVLKEVPVRHMKQLVRSLDVSEREIERAENDHPRACEEAHYQMLRVWAERGPGGGGRVLPRALLQNLLQKLRDMDLGGVAEELETNYGVQ